MARPRNAPPQPRPHRRGRPRALVDAEGLDALSTRRLAAELGVSAPSLYNHFRTKEEILDAVARRIVAGVDLSMFGPGPRLAGRRCTTGRGRTGRRSRAHPNIVPFLARGPGRRPAALRLADAVYGALVDAGWPPGQATRIGATHAVLRHRVGAGLVRAAASSTTATLYDAADYPHLGDAHRLAGQHAQVDESAFETGLGALVDGLERGSAAAGAAEPAGGARPPPPGA